MSITKLFNSLLATVMIAGVFTVSTFAEETVPVVTVKSEAITDLSGTELTSLKGDDVIVMPINVSSTDGRTDAVSFSISYDTDLLTSGIEATSSDEATAYYKENSSQIVLDSTKMMGRIKIVSGTNPLLGTQYVPSTELTVTERIKGTLVFEFAGGTREGYAIDDDCEFYAYFTVNSGVDEKKSLNFPYVTDFHVRSAQGNPTTDKTGKSDYDAELTKLNSCAGAFKVTIDGSALPVWVREVYVKQDGHNEEIPLSPVEIIGETGIYTFPVRVNIGESSSLTATENVTYTIYAKTTTEKDGTDEIDTELGKVTIDLAGTVTSYDTNTVAGSVAGN